MKYQYEPLGDEYEFQTFLKDLFNAIYETNSFEEYGSKGHSQFGMDIYSPELRIGVQAKKKDINRSKKSLLKELYTDLVVTTELIEKFPHDIKHMYFATTTNKYIEIQDACMSYSIGKERKLQFFSWLDIQEAISKFPSIRNRYYPALMANKLNELNQSKEISEKLEILEILLLNQKAIEPFKNKEYRNIPICEILIPLVDLQSQKFIVAFILKVAAFESFVGTEYKKFKCLFDFSSTYTQFADGTSGPGFGIISGEIRFLGNCNRLVRVLQKNPDCFWQIYDEMKENKAFNRIHFRLELLPNEGLTAYEFELDEQTGNYVIKPTGLQDLDYNKLDSFNSVLPFIASTTKPYFHIIEYDKLKEYPAFTKFVYNMTYGGSFQLSAFGINVNDFDDWDYSIAMPANKDEIQF